MRKDFLVVSQRLYGLSMLVRVPQDLVAGHDAALHFIEHDLAAKLDQRATFVAWDGAGMWLKEVSTFCSEATLLPSSTRMRV